MWGDTYFLNHQRVKDLYGPAWMHQCAHCDLMADHWAQIHGTEGDYQFHYKPLCRWCHAKYDQITRLADSGWYQRWLDLHPGEGHKP